MAEEVNDIFCEELDGWCDWSQNGRLRREETFTREDVYKTIFRLQKKVCVLVETKQDDLNKAP